MNKLHFILMKEKKKLLIIIWALCILTNCICILVKIDNDLFSYVQGGLGWGIWMYLFVCYYYTTVSIIYINKVKFRFFDIIKYFLQVGLLICAYDYFTNNYILKKENMILLLIFFDLVIAISLSFQKNFSMVHENYIENHEIEIMIKERIEGVLDEKEKQKIDMLILNNISLIIIITMGIICNVFLEPWGIVLRFSLYLVGILLIIINFKKYKIVRISIIRYVVDMLGIVMGFMFIIFYETESFNLPLLLMQIYCFTPFFLTFFKVRFFCLIKNFIK